jgi:hypothetical protein
MTTSLPFLRSLTAFGTAAALACSVDAQRCADLRAHAAGATSLAAERCLDDTECQTLVGACGEVNAVHRASDVRAMTRTFERLEALCGCDGVGLDGGLVVRADAGAVTLPRAMCGEGTCRVAPDAPPPTDDSPCTLANRDIERVLASPGFCRGLADCDYVGYSRRRGAHCGAGATLGDATRLRRAVDAWLTNACCIGCAACAAPPSSFARCESNRCIGADECSALLTGPRWTVTLRARLRAGEPERILTLGANGRATVTPPGVTTMLGEDAARSIESLARAAALLCTDASFHPPGPAAIEIGAQAGGRVVAIGYDDNDPMPSGLRDLETRLRDLMSRALGGR